MAKFKPDYVPTRGTGDGSGSDDWKIIEELRGRVGKKHWGDLPKDCQTGCLGNLRQLVVRQNGRNVLVIAEGKTEK
ncbi:hypothetical protein A2574_00785 [Candidatus Shapirobacteria bacterium RIFOXYD1_FULL_38_32]|uniref:Uncharacterized protein n=2 Tax=Candidatus Shapironibacteriota TaxID=1752721 RepID=A0A0G0JP95_9BACT|nr:MAG: hypothetical protein US90_C0017G0007 [Candidatus Shapirobacteria bacterium GW2011_GWE2_38_30]KKQ89443.1 MAG: hypothetical protein UT14_C0058G0006 [Candidatus Shapirobacteria bacterium GW2011_GWE1_38_92]OGL56378.1 MAG: hypothetical protein A2195_03265 [Candidatus Shapirobacteria bacterium RIFOXYA1_FULL_39_17]OGL56607.1 MAG: hypothetical protein A2410_01050 [Candidatus Shapirobacteria bacterium RIFOXYC1_FULL_38_24]OGL57997.1 MAG: hypothetical protein A2574_00785 [Candidatus Shapirobacteri